MPPLGRWSQGWRLAAAALIGFGAWALFTTTAGEAPDAFRLWMLVGDPLLGVASLVLVAFRRRWPVPVGIVTNVVSIGSASSGGAALLALCSVATRRRWREIAVVGGTSMTAGFLNDWIYPDDTESPLWVGLIISALGVAATVAVGYAVGSRRELHISLRERAETAERELSARESSARSGERTRIAREMHDVLAHRITLVAMHAGALSYRRDLTPQEQATAARTIEENAQLALQELRDVLGVLRDPASGEQAPERPQPLLTDLPGLVADARAAGMRVDLRESAEGEVPTTASRTAYRVVQEALTNARKHAPGSAVTVEVRGAPGSGLEVAVRNPASLQRHNDALAGAGVGLLGLRERVALAGGRIEHGPLAEGGYQLVVWLPWAA